MIALIQRVTSASVTVNQSIIGKIDHGLLVLLGVESTDNTESITKLANKILNYRVFSDENGKMNLNVKQAGGKLLIVSQFTLVADTEKGLRPSFSRGATPQLAESLYLECIDYCKNSIEVETGQFAADMQVALVNDGPVTFYLKS